MNPLQEWLGIDEDQPNHYQLLGVEEFERDERKLAAAADRAMSKVRSCRPGQHSKQWAALLDRLADAKRCLTDPQQRAQYERRLSAERSAAQTPVLPTPLAEAAADAEAVPPRAAEPMDSDASESTPQAPPPALETPPPAVASALAADGLTPRPEPVASEPGEALPPRAADPEDPQPPLAALPSSGEPDPTEPGFVLNEKGPGQPSGRPAGKWSSVTVTAGVAMVLLLIVAAVLSPPRESFLSGRKDSAPSNSAAVDAEATSVEQPAESKAAKRPHRVQATATQRAHQLREALQRERAAPPRSSPARLEPETPSKANGSGESDGGDASESMQAPASASASPTARPAAKPTEEELAALSQSLSAARRALGAGEFDAASEQLARAKTTARLAEHQALVERLGQLAEHVRDFHTAMNRAIGTLDAGIELKVSESTIVSVVELQDKKLTLHVAGMNRDFMLDDPSPGLAMALASHALGEDHPRLPLLKSAYLAVHPSITEQQLDRARGWLEEAESNQSVAKDLLMALDDDYQLTPEAP